jgi:hypothetical protein
VRRQVEEYDDLARRLRDAARDVRFLAVGAIRLIRSGAEIPAAYPDAVEALATGGTPRVPRDLGDGIAAGIVEEQIGSLARRFGLAEAGETARHDGGRARGRAGKLAE